MATGVERSHRRSRTPIVGDITIVDDDDAAATLMGGCAVELHNDVVEVLAEQERDPSHAAVVFGEQVLGDYVGSRPRRNRVARGSDQPGCGCWRHCGGGSGAIAESVVAVWGVAEVGAAFLPIDPRLPGDRIGFMLADSGASIGITTDAIGGALPDHRWLTVAELTRCGGVGRRCRHRSWCGAPRR